MASKKTLSRNIPVWHNGKFYFSINLQETPEEKKIFDSRVARLCNEYGTSMTDLLFNAVMRGFADMELELKENNGLVPPKEGDPGYQEWVRFELLQSSLEHENKMNELDILYQRYGHQRFIEIAEEKGLDVAEFLVYKKHAPTRQKTQAELDKEFLNMYLSERLEPVPADQLKEAAIKAGIIHVDDSGEVDGWQRLEKTAERQGYKCKNPRAHYCSIEYNSTKIQTDNIRYVN